ncbi:RagB/SusD family nutrient uptake outer membrane protein [Solitalea canadensis]|uniref:RagB/SusD family protein n=1 Tax=Solitalea canadensis (strain ATCC 29591 / DSM 3403 / JCM 21819 / LMG 8368 / NBRC 15130 / NCIMB 12057 / USAM 9D) TaxID=929556 RepID=H8KQG6_SOLCM|nr:RagB/SusD family nutrient uptake outer membrane protein [Solitalea canadensis]AFD06582.1 RagB/SusD family protein [Solitalea canadensis DSM 3403]
MNKILKKYIVVVFGFSTLAGCNLVNVTDIEPVNQLSDDQAITNISSAEKVLTGAYGQVRGGLELIIYTPGSTGQLGLTFVGVGDNSFVNNSVSPEDKTLSSIYIRLYKIINITNHIIEKTEKLDVENPRKAEIIGEAKFLRALSHFYLLRLWGQFYNMDSGYGIIKRDKPVADAVSVPRNTVKECYDLIFSDLDYAIEHAPEFTKAVYASKTTAMALKAKVLLYAKKYQEISDLTRAVIASGKVKLEPIFADVFKLKYNSTEVLFATPFDDKKERNNKPFMFRSSYLLSDYYKNIMTTDTRKSAAITSSGRNGKFLGATIDNKPLPADTEYFLRLAEVYLIQAEALVRSGSSFVEARSAINAVRKRAGMPDITVDTKAELLEAIRMEKIYELGAESGEEWFDMIRYAIEGDINIELVKSTIKSEAQYIMPIPINTIRTSQGLIKQNPGY